MEDSCRFFGLLGRERAQFFAGVVAEVRGQEEEVDQSQRKADISSLAGVGALQSRKQCKKFLDDAGRCGRPSK